MLLLLLRLLFLLLLLPFAVMLTFMSLHLLAFVLALTVAREYVLCHTEWIFSTSQYVPYMCLSKHTLKQLKRDAHCQCRQCGG